MVEGRPAQHPALLQQRDVLYDVNRIVTVTFGGAPNYEGGVSSAVFVIDISAGPGKDVTVRRTASMRYPRALHNSVVLPTGQVF